MRIPGGSEREGRGGSTPPFRFRWFPDGLLAVLLLYGIVLLFRDILPARRELVALDREAARLEKRVQALSSEERRLGAFADALRRDPQALERFLRLQFRSHRPGEKVLRFEEDGEDPSVEDVLR